MKFDQLLGHVGGLPATPNGKCKILYDFILEKEINDVLELGFFHGKTSLVMAAALEERKAGKVVTIDMLGARNYKPNIEQLIAQTGLGPHLTPVFSPRGSQWELRNVIREATVDGVCEPRFDFCFIDAHHSWECAALDFFLCDKMLKPGGWMLFDDLAWSFETSPSWSQLPETRAMPEDYRKAAQVGEVFELLVGQHPGYVDVVTDDNWGWARKKPA